MILKLRLMAISISSGIMVILILCLGAQNLNVRKNVNLITTKSEAFPSGFLVGVAIALGVISGGSTKALIIPNKNKEEEEEN
tara:strand:- start:1494 stop:1739 length:246 start_codon:yes stop_codon:yes gene_type:complete